MSDHISHYYVLVRSNVACPLCKLSGKVMLTDGDEHLWKNPRPCPVCEGVGQIHKSLVPCEEEIDYRMMNYFKFK